MTQAEKNSCLELLQNWAREENIPLAVRKETSGAFKGTYTISYDGGSVIYNLSKSEIYKTYAGLYNFIIAIRDRIVKV